MKKRCFVQVSKKTFVVTDGGSGIGREIVTTLLINDATVVAIDINEKALTNSVIDMKSNQLSTYQLDICDKESVDTFVQTNTQKYSSFYQCRRFNAQTNQTYF